MQPPDGLACYICLEGDRAADSAAENGTEDVLGVGPLHRCGCACRESAGLCHLSCAVRAARSQNRLWHDCSTCKQKWSGQFALQLAQERCRQSTESPNNHRRERVLAALDLTQALRDNGRLAEARSLGTQMLVTMRRIYGDDHQLTLSTMAGLAVAHNGLGDSTAALPLETERLEACLRTLGDDHRDTKNAKVNFAGTLFLGLGKVEEALPLMKEITDARRAELGSDHIETITSMGNLASLYYRMRRPDLELNLSMEVVERSRRVLGRQHHQTLLYTGHFGALLSDLNCHDPAISLLQQPAAGLLAAYGEQHPHTRTVDRDLQKAHARRDSASDRLPTSTGTGGTDVYGRDWLPDAGEKHGCHETHTRMRMCKRARVAENER